MIYVLAAALFVFLCGAKFVKSGEFNSDYMSKDTTGAINGIFVLLVFMCHISGYMKLGGSSDTIWLDLKSWLGQLVVVTFLFYSGYGMMCSIMKKRYAVCQGYFQAQVPEPFCAFRYCGSPVPVDEPRTRNKDEDENDSARVHYMGEHRQLELVYYRGSLPLSDIYSVVSYLPQAPYPGAYRDDRTHLRTRFCAYKSRKARVVLQHADSLPAGYVVCVSQEIYRQIRDEKQLYLYALHYGRGCCLCCRT